MASYLLHQGRDGYPFGVYRSMEAHFYGGDAVHKIPYGAAVVGSIGDANTWENWIQQLASKFPGPQDQWDIILADDDADLESVLDAARKSRTYGD